jgi:prepilin-type N-terminal cleavage/methylation domain-containing protein
MKNGRSGFTLVEVLAAVAILATAFYLLLELRQSALQSAVYSSKRLLAVQIARTKMEETIAMGFPDAMFKSEVVSGLPVNINVQDIGDDTNLGALRKVQVEVTYDIGFGEDNRYVLTTILSPLVIKDLPKPLEDEQGNPIR